MRISLPSDGRAASFYRPSGSRCQSDLLFPGASRSESRTLLKITRLSSACWWITAVCLHLLLLCLRSSSVLNLPCDSKANISLVGIINKSTYFLIVSRLCSVDARLAHLVLFVWQHLLKKLLHVPWSFLSPCLTEYFIALVSFFACQSASCSPFFLLFVCVCGVCSVVSDHLFTLHRNSLSIV